MLLLLAGSQGFLPLGPSPVFLQSESDGAGFKLQGKGGYRVRRSGAVRGRGKKRAAWQPHAWHSSQPVTPPTISALSPAPSVTSVVTPVILTLPQEAGYPRSAYSVPKAKTGGKGCGRQLSRATGLCHGVVSPCPGKMARNLLAETF